MTGTIACLVLSVAAAQTQDQDLASTLVDRGWVDLAEDLVARHPTTLGKDPYTLARIASAKARQERSVEAAVQGLDVAISGLRNVGRARSGRETALLGTLLVQKASLLSETANGPGAWQAAESHYRDTIAALSRTASTPDLENLLLDLRLELPRVLTARSKLSTLGDAPRKALREEAVRLLQDFQLDTGNRPIAFEAILEEGRVRMELKNYPQAERCFRAVLNLDKNGAPLQGYLAALWDAAFLGRIRILTLSGKAKEAASSCVRYLQDHPTRARSPMGKSLLLLQAEATHAAGNDGAAIGLAQRAVGMDPDGALGQAARDRIREWMKGAQATPERMLLVAEGLIDQGRYRDALIDLRRCVEVCAGASERSTFEPLTAFKRGVCYRALKREEEASVAFQDVFRKYPRHDLAPRAAFEAVRSLSSAAASTRDPRDQDRQERLLKEIDRLGLQGSFAPYFKFLEAEILERKGQWKPAADRYQEVDDTCELYEDALVSGAHCLRRDAEQAGAQSGDEELRRAEDLLRRALLRLERSPESRLLPPAEFELASLCLSGAIHKPKDALTYLDRCSKRLSAGQELQARLGEMALRAHLDLDDLPAAVNRLGNLLRSFPDHPSTARAALQLAGREEAADAPAALKYYRVWLDRTEATGSTTGQLQAATEGLTRVARSLNQFGDRTVSVVDLRGKPVPDQGAWRDSARALERLLAAPDLPERERVGVQARLAWALGLAAQSIEEWSRLKKHCEGLIASNHLLDGNGDLDPRVLQAHRWLAGITLEYGHALYQLGRLGQKFQYTSATRVFNGLSTMTQAGSEPWWISKFLGLRVLFERGQGDDLRVAGAALSLLEGNYPDFDGGKYGIREPLLTLKTELNALRGRSR